MSAMRPHSRHALVGRRLWECAACSYQVSLTSGTVLHNTKTPLTVWFWAAYLMTTDKRGVSALLIQRQLGLRRYETAWMMLHKLRRAMVNDAREPLRGSVEIDDTWVGGTQAGIRGSRQLKGRRAALVLAAVEKRGTSSGRIRMAVIPDFKATTINDFLTRNVAPGSTIFTDGLKTFTGLDKNSFSISLARNPGEANCTRERNPWCPLLTVPSGTSSSGFSVLTMGLAARNCRSTWTSSFFGTIAEGNPWPHSRRSSVSEPRAYRRRTTTYAAPEASLNRLHKVNPNI